MLRRARTSLEVVGVSEEGFAAEELALAGAVGGGATGCFFVGGGETRGVGGESESDVTDEPEDEDDLDMGAFEGDGWCGGVPGLDTNGLMGPTP